MKYRYKALKNDKIVNGSVEAEGMQDALAYLKHNGLFTIEVAKESSDSLAVLRSMLTFVSFGDIVDLTRQLAIMLNAGLTLIDAFDILKKQIGKGPVLSVLESIDKEIKSGESFSKALKRYPHLFSNIYIALVQAGEASGKVNEVLMKLAENLEKEREFKGKIKGAMIYPAIVVSGMFMVMFVMITFVIPKLLTLYQDLDVELPLSTQVLVIVSNFSQKFWPLIIIAVIGIGLGIRNYFRTKAGKIVKDNLMLKIPYFSKVIRIASLVDATRTLAILIGSGVSILEGLKIIIDTSDNVVFQNAFRNIYVKVEKGVSLGQAMADEKVFPPILVQMTTVGEQTGHLDATLLRLSNYFEIESEFAVKAVTSLIEPAIIIVLGLGVGLLVFSVITPIYSLTNKF